MNEHIELSPEIYARLREGIAGARTAAKQVREQVNGYPPALRLEAIIERMAGDLASAEIVKDLKAIIRGERTDTGRTGKEKAE